MGYNAFVVCNCYQQGLTSPPPYPELLRLDEDGLYLETPAGLWEQDPERVLAMDQAFDEWKSSACLHPAMEVASERLANMSGMAAFRRFVRERGGVTRYPVLTEHLPRANGGHLPAALAPALLQELATLVAEPADKLAVLREQASQELLYSVGANDHTVFVYVSDQQHYALDAQGFSIVRRFRTMLGEQYIEEQFRSMAFSQRQLDSYSYQFTDAATGKHYQCQVGLSTHPAEAALVADFAVTIEMAPVVGEYAYIMEPLRRLAEAARATGNPICWC